MWRSTAPVKGALLVTEQDALDKRIGDGGESGVGKEVPRPCHPGRFGRAGQPFVAVNCGAIPDTLIESILFGHEKGAFTGAVDRHIGKFQEANGGTLFLDEIGELRLDIAGQAACARSKKAKSIRSAPSARQGRHPLGLGDQPQSAAAGHGRKIPRRSVLPLETSSRSRCRRSASAAKTSRTSSVNFIRRFAVEENKKVVGIDTGALDMLQTFNWPGNIRQLENTVFRAVVLCDGECLHTRDFPQVASQLGMTVPAALDLDDEPLPGEMPTRYVSITPPPAPAALEPGASIARRHQRHRHRRPLAQARRDRARAHPLCHRQI